MPYASHVVEEESDAYRKVIVEIDGETIYPNSHSKDEYRTCCDALNTGTLALAAAEGQPYENEAADPPGNSDSETDVDPAARSVRHHRGEARI